VIPRIAGTPRAFARDALHGAFRAVGIAVALAFVAACAPGDRPAEDRASQAFTPTQGAALPSFLARMPEAPFTTALSGVRRASFFWSTSAGESRLVHEERVAADGQGRFLVEPLVVHEPAMTSEQAQLFALLQKNREGFLWRWRDFRIRDLSLFQQNWQLEVVGERTVASASASWSRCVAATSSRTSSTARPSTPPRDSCSPTRSSTTTASSSPRSSSRTSC
jgi:hypothetical protein